MSTVFFAGPDGRVRGFGDGAKPPVGWDLVPPPESGFDKWDAATGQYIPRFFAPARPVNEQLEERFLGLIPNHDGKVYLTDDVIDSIIGAKLKVTEAVKLSRFDYAKKIMEALRKKLPTEMVSDLDTLKGMLP